MIRWCRTTEAVLDSATLSGLVGQPVRATRLRIKPGLSTVAALQRVDGSDGVEGRRDTYDGLPNRGEPGESRLVGWVYVCAPGQHDKVGHAIRRAAERGLVLPSRSWPGDPGLVVAWGRPETDPRLHRGLDGLRDSLPDAHLLRYNPLRRMVLREPETGDVLRITANAHRTRTAGLAVALANQGVATLTPLPPRSGDRERVSRWPFFGGADLARRTGDALAAERSAIALAGLHAVPVNSMNSFAGRTCDLPMRDEQGLSRRLAAATSMVTTVIPELTADVVELVAQVHRRCSDDIRRAGHQDRLAVCHGDFSADQVLVGPDGVRIIDLDRSCIAPPALDLGSLRATGPLHLTASVEQAYRGVLRRPDGERFVDLGDVAGWTGYAQLLRLTEPLRDGASDVEARIRRRLAACRDVLSARTVPDVVHEGRTSLTVQRAWPTDGHNVAIEGVDSTGRLRAGRIRRQPSPHGGAIEERVSILPFGQDPQLPALAKAISGQAELVVHRAGKRAVVRAEDHYLKILRPGRGGALVSQAQRGSHLASEAGLAAPVMLRGTADGFASSILAGKSVHELGWTASESTWREVWRRWCEAWQSWQASKPLSGARCHDGAAEADVLRGWARKAERHRVLTLDERVLDRAAGDLAQGWTQPFVPAHRDLHDKQLIDDGHRLGVLDLDTVGMAEPALDLANLAVHARLRVLQRCWAVERADVVVGAVNEVVGTLDVDPRRLRAYIASTWLRLACVYAFRPRWNVLAHALADPHERTLMFGSFRPHPELTSWQP